MSSNSGRSSAPRLVAPSFSLAGVYLTANSALLCNGIQQHTTMRASPPPMPPPGIVSVLDCLRLRSNSSQLLTGLSRCPSWYSLRMDPTENPFSCSCFITVWHGSYDGPTKNTTSHSPFLVGSHSDRRRPHRKHCSHRYFHWLHCMT
jgi:hypothetical protein